MSVSKVPNQDNGAVVVLSGSDNLSSLGHCWPSLDFKLPHAQILHSKSYGSSYIIGVPCNGSDTSSARCTHLREVVHAAHATDTSTWVRERENLAFRL